MIDVLIKEIANAADEPAVVKRLEEKLTAAEHRSDELLRRHTKMIWSKPLMAWSLKLKLQLKN